MEANDFVTKLKADGSKNDLTDLDDVFKDYKALTAKLASKDRGPFSLNVLCILCRNLEKVPSWYCLVDSKALLTLAIECVRETRVLKTEDQVKVLACVYHIHRHVVRVKTPIPPELVLKLSYMPFDNENILTEYCKTYWNILADRVSYIEKLKASKMNVMKLLTKLTEDIVKVIKVYNTTQFCSTILTFLVKKLHFLFSNLNVTDLNTAFVKIFEALSSKSDVKSFKKLPDKEIFDLYVKLNDCLYVVAENASKNDFAGGILNIVVQMIISIVGHLPDLLHCVQNIFLNGFCSILTERSNLAYTETILENMKNTCETSEKLGYAKAMTITYPYINQFLRLYIEYNVNNKHRNWSKIFPETIQISCLKMIQFLIVKLKDCEQLLKCEGCTVKTGLHDGLRLSFLVKHFITISVEQNIDITNILPIYHAIIVYQYGILKELCVKGCVNYEKCYRKLQSDIHNTAILLNKSQNFEFSVKLFDIYVKNEVLYFKNEEELKNISRALYNKSICELDAKQYENALSDAYLSLIFAYPDCLSSEKHMSLIMDIKAKELKSRSEEEDLPDDLQMTTVLDACAEAVEKKKYGNLKPFFCDLKFSELLKHEFEMYSKLWPSIIPVAAVWKTLWGLTNHDIAWTKATDDLVQETLHNVVLRTPNVVRTIHSEHFVDTLNEILAEFQNSPPSNPDQKVVYASILLLKSEYNLSEASQKYGWKNSDTNNLAYRTLKQEQECMKPALKAAVIWNEIVKEIKNVKNTDSLANALRTAQVFVPQLLVHNRIAHGLQLAHVCCQIALHIGDRPSYLQNASSILYLANKQTEEITNIIKLGSEMCSQLIKHEESREPALVFLCDCAIYYQRIGMTNLSVKLIQAVQAKILSAHENNNDENLDLAIGHVLEAATLVHSGYSPTMLTAVVGAHRHYLTACNNATKWSSRRLRSLCTKLGISTCSKRAILLTASLCTLRRACAVLAATQASAPTAIMTHVADTADTYNMEDTQTIIDNRLKHYLGVQPSTDQPIITTFKNKSQEPFTPKQELETMLDHVTFKKTQISPSLPCLDVPGFRIPDFLTHNSGCQCHLCQNRYSLVIICQTAFLEASMYFRAKEFDIARNYFEGAHKCFELAEKKLRNFKNHGFENYVADIAEKILSDDFSRVQINLLKETAFFELAQDNYRKADENIIRIHEVLQDYHTCEYMKNEIFNLMSTSAYLRKGTHKKIDEFNLEAEFESLKLSPANKNIITEAKTPESKPKNPPQIEKIKVKDEEVPNSKRRVIKLNLDDNSEEKVVNTRPKRTAFKIPVPVTAKPVLESMTPTPRKIPNIKISQPSVDESSNSILDFATPKPKNMNKSEFFTPLETPSEQFFTPMSTLKTYTKKNLRKDVIKNLETEFATPKSEVKKAVKVEKNTVEIDKENETKTVVKKAEKVEVDKENRKRVETGTLKCLKDKRTLKRATSPGKLEKVEKNEKKPVRSSRLRQPVRFSLDDEK